ncbi:MAG: outer membrane lipoprotein chaperone LolA [Gammaproteobacteria bacterium]|nr:outer membrane lipoprotein chaperone LolA [Gammaproteobacteria bacterium]
MIISNRALILLMLLLMPLVACGDAATTETRPEAPGPLASVTQESPSQEQLPQNPDVQDPDIQDPDIQDPDIQEPDIQEPDIQEPDIQEPDSFNPSLGQRLLQYHQFQGQFTQTTINAQGGIIETTTGELWLASPDRFRIETREPLSQTLVSDGHALWNYDIDLEQVIISQLDRATIPVLLLAQNDQEIEQSYETGYFEDEQSEVFVLAPKAADSLYKTLSIEFSGNRLTALLIRDGMGQATQIVFDEINNRDAIDPERFTFTVPPGVEVIQD